MNKIITNGLLVCAFAFLTFATEPAAEPYQKIRIGVNGDYSWVAMNQVNKQLKRGAAVTPLRNGIAGMLDLDFAPAPFLLAGVRVGYLYCMPGKATYDSVLYTQAVAINSSLIPLEAGLSLRFVLPATPITILAGIYGGYGFAFASYKNDISPSAGQTSTFTQLYNGHNFIGELHASANVKLFSAVSFGINGGYRLAIIPQMVQTQDVSYNGMPGIQVGSKDDILKDAGNNKCAFDFSGFNIGAGVSLGF